MEESTKTEHIIIDIPEMSLGNNAQEWQKNIKIEFGKLQEKFAPGKENYSYFTWFWFFIKYGDCLFTDEVQQKIVESGNIFNFIKDSLGISTSSGGAYLIGYNFFNSLLRDRREFDVCGIKFRRASRETAKVLETPKESNPYASYLRAMRTKPFLLLAGISGTGKSRIVKEMAFDSCPNISELRKDPTSPGNYCLVEVKPNWHDSTELLGYESRINGAEYIVTPFVKFLAKAMLYEDIPFFLCLDEMNLAPVEQYLAEFLSVLESRKKVNQHIVSEPIIKPEIFANKDYELKLQDDLFGLEIKEELTSDGGQRIVSGQLSSKAQSIYDNLKRFGLYIPENIIVIGTVNMDETTHQFSRKVIDRAMTIEMNLPEGDPFMDFYNSRELDYRDSHLPSSLFIPSTVSASEALDELAKVDLEKAENLKKDIAGILSNLNMQLEDTPFKIAYRVQNELVIYFYEAWREQKDSDWSTILTDAFDNILMMKVLPRIEGDDDLLEKPLERLADFCVQYPKASKKIQEMRERLNRSHFTSYWP